MPSTGDKKDLDIAKPGSGNRVRSKRQEIWDLCLGAANGRLGPMAVLMRSILYTTLEVQKWRGVLV